MKQRTITVSIFETVTDEQFEDILSVFRIVEGVCGAELVRNLPPIPKRPPRNGYQPIGDSLDTSNPPQSGSGVPRLHGHTKAVACPVCHGTGYIDAGFYNQTSGQWSSAGGTEQCKSCNGKGFVVI